MDCNDGTRDADTLAAQIKLSEEKLFNEWRLISPKMVMDGAICPKAYADSNLKIILILKQVNDPDGGGWDLRKYLFEGGRPQTWDNVTRWLKGIRSLPIDLSWKELKKVEPKERIEHLSSIAVMNLKKEPGGYTSVDAEIVAAARKRTSLLQQQFSIYNPDLVIFCGTCDAGVKVLFPDGIKDWKETSRGVSYAKFGDNKTMIAFSHPEARCAKSFTLYALLDAVREVLVSR